MLSNIFVAEIVAIYRALSLCQSFHVVNVVIFADSQAAIRGLCGLGYSADMHPLIADCRRIISQIKETGNVTLVWVPGHKGIFGNEKGDLLAKDGSSVEISYNKIFSLDYRRISAQLVKEKWKDEFRTSALAQRYKAVIGKRLQKPWFSKLKYGGREFITTLCRLRFNHNQCRCHLYRLNLVDNPNCDCGEIEDLDHIFFGCNRTACQSNVLIQEIIQCGATPPFNVSSLLATERIQIYTFLYKFLKSNILI
ncbi:RNase H [Popillia japonica]|uniref:RNase H n=1 Tax=Popillia japonica TaxID=7064 RepID=A0AAW1HYM9_POPJA